MPMSTTLSSPTLGATPLVRLYPRSAAPSATRTHTLIPELIVPTHPGRTLLLLGHAAEYLIDLHSVSIDGPNHPIDAAIHILRELSRSIFDDYAKSVSEAPSPVRIPRNRAANLFN
jgi:hypothetical protein